ncbi:hypothetical protein GCM10009534_33130 [Kribbella sandramycini]
MSTACPSADLVSALFARSGPQPFLARSALVSDSTCASGAPDPLLGFGSGFGVAV